MNDRLLIVDDENGIRSLLGINLSKMGYTWDEAGDAYQALEKIEERCYSLVLLDISMPGMTGRELLPLIKEKCPDTAVIMATALADTSLAVKCMKEGAYDYLTKPFDFNNLESSIYRALEKRRLELENLEYKEHLEEKVEEQADKIRQSFFNAMTSLAYALEARDEYTSGHSNRVTVSALAISEQLGVDPIQTETIRLASMVHDIGKIGIKENVLNKPGKLTEEEFRHIKTHPEIGERILQPVVDNQEIISIVRHHHERYDGNGYPDGLKAEEIPLGARILAVADSYDAMTSQRPYRAALHQNEALDELGKGKGTQFDPQMVDIFISFSSRQQEENNIMPG